MAKTLDDYLKEITTLAGGRDLSTTWYREQIRKVVPKRIQEGTLRQMIRQGGPSTRPIYGIMNLFYYMPKYEETLPYYDTFPLVIPIKRLPGGFLGLNFHYLSVPLRIKLMEKLLPMTKENRILGWNRVSKFRLVKPCVKRYLMKQVGTRFLMIPDADMPLVNMMPLQRFKKESYRKVHAESRRMLR